jgi:hypothetical protein
LVATTKTEPGYPFQEDRQLKDKLFDFWIEIWRFNERNVYPKNTLMQIDSGLQRY